jgi:glycosyltransferase involved in cell wall biosynthesis
MRGTFPRSLVQIHYHNRAGGVARVLDGYAAAFARLGWGEESLIICRNCRSPSGRVRPARIISVDACDYRAFRTERGFDRVARALAVRLRRIITAPELPRPVCVVGHNLSLGKNIALSAAFSRLAREFRDEGEIRFFSVIHDFAEEGRTALLRDTRHLALAGVATGEALYPSVNVRYVTLNRRNHLLLKKAGAASALLPNPIDIERLSIESKASRTEVMEALHRLARRDKVGFNPSRPLIFYPVRVIGRKNVVEAIIAVCILLDASLVIGAPGASDADQRLYARLKAACRRFRLPVIFDCERIAPDLTRRAHTQVAADEVFPLLYRTVDCCITTSVAEGFGYALFEPWVCGCAVIGRRPMGFSALRGMCMTHLYNRFDLPAAWIPPVMALGKHARASSSGAGDTDPRNATAKRYTGNGRLDVGKLDLDQQLAVLDRLCAEPETRQALSPVRVMLQKQLNAWREGKTQQQAITLNQRIVSAQLAGEAFGRHFGRCFRKETADAVGAIDSGSIAAYFDFPLRSRPLLDS